MSCTTKTTALTETISLTRGIWCTSFRDWLIIHRIIDAGSRLSASRKLLQHFGPDIILGYIFVVDVSCYDHCTVDGYSDTVHWTYTIRGLIIEFNATFVDPIWEIVQLLINGASIGDNLLQQTRRFGKETSSFEAFWSFCWIRRCIHSFPDWLCRWQQRSWASEKVFLSDFWQ